ncbi:uncharacterized protein LOC131845678 [Achroia grisella]|uniref:uncharacterized protein LOC131845678 n=1 Tax=Achroia grisella TaxID=688607 RepID=UPI0027D2A6A4|nr:uncharacterized protein LOC131845678 [Achroia grisella]
MDVFIETVKKYPNLWDVNDATFKDFSQKNGYWQKVAKATGLPGASEAKLQWKRLRDCYREALRRRKITIERGLPVHGRWKYEHLMEFLLPLPERKEKQHSNKNFTPEFEINLDTEPIVTCNRVIPALPTLENLNTEKLLTRFNTENIENTIQIERVKRRELRRKERQQTRQEAVEANRFDNDAITELFSSLCRKTKELPKYLQLRVQREIFESVSRAEEEALTFEQTIACNSPMSSTSSYEYQHLRPGSSTMIQPKEEIDIDETVLILD